jgi:solute carrier family 45 protein 1/2/4
MAFPTNVDADPDPTTQIAWPSKRLNRDAAHHSSDTEAEQDREIHVAHNNGKPGDEMLPGKRTLSTRDLVNLTISMGGSQIAWTVELG